MKTGKPIRVLFIITGLGMGGAEITLLKTIQGMDRKCFAIEVVSLADKGEIGKEIELLGVPVVALDIQKQISDLGKFLQLIRIIRTSQPDIVHTWMYHADLFGGIASRLAGVRTVCWSIHHGTLLPQCSKLSTRLVMRTCALISKVVPKVILCPSEEVKTIHSKAGYDAVKMKVIPHGVDFKHFAPDAQAYASVRHELILNDSVKLVGMFARYNIQKNYSGFFEVAAAIHAACPHVHFVLAGSGVDDKNIELIDMMQSTKLEKYIHLLGPRNDIPRLMASLDLYVSTSHGEAFSLVLIEALASGVLSVSTDLADPANILEQYGATVSAGEMRALAESAIHYLQLSSEERSLLGDKARHSLRQQYDLSNVIHMYEILYKDCCTENGLCY